MDYMLFPDALTMDFPTSFTVASAAVVKELWILNRAIHPPVVTTPGLLEAKMRRNGVYVFSLLVQERAADIVSLEATLIVPADPIQLIAYRQHHLAGVITDLHTIYLLCARGIVQSVRRTYPAYGNEYIDGITPMPPMLADPTPILYTQVDWIRLFLWKDVNAPAMKDEELSQLIGRDKQTIRNERQKFRTLIKQAKAGRILAERTKERHTSV